MARRRLPRAIFDFFDGGAEDEGTLQDNRAAFERVRLLPKVLVDVAKADTAIELFGAPTRLPMAIAPTGGIGAGRAGAELMLARAAKAYGIPFTLATPSTVSLERVAKEAGGRLWFQLYVVRDREFREKLVERAKNNGYEALLVTVDLPVSGKRERDPRNGFVTPFRPNLRNTRDVLLRPAWILDVLRNGLPGMANFEGYKFSSTEATDIATAVGREMDASLDWEYAKRLRDLWPGKLLLKGVERPDDALRAAQIGCDGIVVSNHGGRQLDGAAAGLDALPEVVEAVEGRCEVYVDGGVRRGGDVLKALALGARAAFAARAFACALAVGGEQGVGHALSLLRDEIALGLGLLGCTSPDQVTRAHVEPTLPYDSPAP